MPEAVRAPRDFGARAADPMRPGGGAPQHAQADAADQALPSTGTMLALRNSMSACTLG